MTNPAEIIPGVIFYTYLSTERKARVGFLAHNTLVLLVSGHFTLETSVQKITMSKGEMLLIGKNQLGQITKTPLPGEDYETIIISLQEDLLRTIALEERIEMLPKYVGPPNVLIPANDFLKGYFQILYRIEMQAHLQTQKVLLACRKQNCTQTVIILDTSLSFVLIYVLLCTSYVPMC
jgi:hypothetical protein